MALRSLVEVKAGQYSISMIFFLTPRLNLYRLVTHELAQAEELGEISERYFTNIFFKLALLQPCLSLVFAQTKLNSSLLKHLGKVGRFSNIKGLRLA